MNKKIDIGFGVELEILDTSYAKTHKLINNEARMDQFLGFKLK
jgi:hypothetical protein